MSHVTIWLPVVEKFTFASHPHLLPPLVSPNLTNINGFNYGSDVCNSHHYRVPFDALINCCTLWHMLPHHPGHTELGRGLYVL